jgi:hypothetical protein
MADMTWSEPDGSQGERLVIRVPGPEHLRAAREGDRIVANSHGSSNPVSPIDFRACYEAAE